MAEYLAHVTWSTIVAYREELRKAAVGKASERLPLTDQYGSDQPLLDKLRYGDGLWLFTAPVLGRGKGRRTLPPSVLGRIGITHRWNADASRMQPAAGAPAGTPQVRDTRVLSVSRYKFWRCGNPGDPLPIHNAFSLFRSLTFKGRVKQVSPACKGCNQPDVPGRGPFGHLMQHFQAIRTLTDESAQNLARLHNHVAARRTIFLSHKHDEAGSLVREVAECLRDDALCWWDVQALPQSRLYTDSLLQEMLRDGIRQAGWFLAFLTPCYARDGWTDKEYQEALAFCRSLSKGPMIVPVLLGGGLREGMDEQFAIDGGAGARAIVDAILARFASTHM